MSNCIKSLPNLLSGMGSFMQGKFVDAATAWGIDPKTGGPTVLQKELSVPVIGNNGKSLVPNNLTPYQQGVIDGQRLCGYTLSGLAGKGFGAAAKSVVGKVAPLLKGGVGATGPKPAGGVPGEPSAEVAPSLPNRRQANRTVRHPPTRRRLPTRIRPSLPTPRRALLSPPSREACRPRIPSRATISIAASPTT
jgi:hypothetical protein